MEPKIDLRGMINLDQIEDLLSEVLMRMEAQDKNVKKLNDAIEMLMPRKSVERSINDLHDAIKVLSGRVDAVREASMSTVDDKLISSGKLSAGNKLRLDEAFEHLSEVSNKVQLLEADMKSSLSSHEKALQILQGDYTPINMSRALQAGLKECGSRTDLCEMALTKKVDKSALGHIESLAVDLEKYSNHRKITEEKLTDLETQTLKLLNEMEKQSTLLKHNTQNDESFVKVTSMKQEELEKGLKSVQSLLQSHELSISQECVHKAAFGELLSWSDNASELMHNFEQKHKSIKEEIDCLLVKLDSKANSEDVTKHYMKRDKLCSIIESMGKDIELRAKVTELQGTNMTLKSLQDFVTQQNSHLQIALRFVEWFTQRGDTYECNMQVIDKHLKQLATSAVGSVPGSSDSISGDRNPYSSHTSQTFKRQPKVRYISIHPPSQALDDSL